MRSNKLLNTRVLSSEEKSLIGKKYVLVQKAPEELRTHKLQIKITQPGMPRFCWLPVDTRSKLHAGYYININRLRINTYLHKFNGGEFIRIIEA